MKEKNRFVLLVLVFVIVIVTIIMLGVHSINKGRESIRIAGIEAKEKLSKERERQRKIEWENGAEERERARAKAEAEAYIKIPDPKVSRARSSRVWIYTRNTSTENLIRIGKKFNGKRVMFFDSIPPNDGLASTVDYYMTEHWIADYSNYRLTRTGP